MLGEAVEILTSGRRAAGCTPPSVSSPRKAHAFAELQQAQAVSARSLGPPRAGILVPPMENSRAPPALVLAFLLLSTLVGCGSKKKGLQPGDDAVIQNRTPVPFATKLEDLERWISAEREGEMPRRQRMLASKSIALVPHGTRVTLREIKDTTARVTIRSGPHNGKEGWCPMEHLRWR